MLRLRELRTLRKMSQQALADYIGVTQATLSGWENGKYEMDNQSLAKCADYFGVTTGYLLGLEDEKFYPPDVSRKMCEEIVQVKKDHPEKFSDCPVSASVWSQIQAGTYPFSDVTFNQFSRAIGKTADDFLPPKGDLLEGMDFALYGEAHDLTDEEKEDVLNFMKFLKSKRGE